MEKTIELLEALRDEIDAMAGTDEQYNLGIFNAVVAIDEKITELRRKKSVNELKKEMGLYYN